MVYRSGVLLYHISRTAVGVIVRMAVVLFKPSAVTKLGIPYVPSIIKQSIDRGDISSKEVRQEYIRLSNIMRKRQRAILKNVYTRPYAVPHNIKNIGDIKTNTELYKELSYLAGRLDAPTSSVTNIKEVINKTIKTLQKVKESPEGEIIRQEVKWVENREDLKRFGDFMELKKAQVDSALWKYVSSEWVDEWNLMGGIEESR